MHTEYKPLRCGYYAVYPETYLPAENLEIPAQLFDVINIAFATLDDESNLVSPTEEIGLRIQEVVKKCRTVNPNVAIFISSDYGRDMDERYNKAAKNPEKFANSVLNYLKKFDLDGYDIDWESFQINEYSDSLASLVKACHDLFQRVEKNSRGYVYKVTHAVLPGVHNLETISKLSNIVDRIHLMCYGPWCLKEMAEAYRKTGFPLEKIIVGVNSEDGSDTVNSIDEKIAIIKELQLGGIYNWLINHDTPSKTASEENCPSTFKVSLLMYEKLK